MSAGAKSGENDCDTHSSERENLLSGWLKKFYNSQKTELKPWVFCDGSKGFSYIEVTVKGARHNNEDTSYADGKLFGVFDGHGGKHASSLLRIKLAECFYNALGSTDLTKICDEGSPPTVVKALDTAYIRCQELMPTDYPLAQSGSTAVACWVHPNETNGPASKIFASCLGDSKALVFDNKTGAIAEGSMRVWDEEQGTLKGKGITKSGRYETESHGLTGDLKIAKDGSPNGMNNDPTGVGFREFELLRKKHNFAPSRRPFNISNMPGEERWRVLEVEPTRAVGHRMKKEHPLQHPEVFEWKISNGASQCLLLSCDGFFSKEAFRTPDMVTHFLTDPVGYCKRPDFFTGTCLEALLIKIHEADSLPDPGQVSMSELFDAIFNVVYNKLSDDTWTSAYESAHEYLQMFANEKPVPNIRTSPAKTILAACYLAVLMVSDDNVSCSMVILDGKKHFGGESFELGVAAHECP